MFLNYLWINKFANSSNIKFYHEKEDYIQDIPICQWSYIQQEEAVK